MPPASSIACTRCISVVPGLAKQTSTPAAAAVRIRLSAPFTAADLIRGRECGACGRYDVSTALAEPPRLLRTWNLLRVVDEPALVGVPAAAVVRQLEHEVPGAGEHAEDRVRVRARRLDREQALLP